MTRAEQYVRDLAIFLEAKARVPHRVIAERHGTSTKTVQRALRICERNVSKGGTALPAIAERFVQIDTTIEELGRLCADGASPGTRIAAMALQAHLMRGRMDLVVDLYAVGVSAEIRGGHIQA